MIKTTQIVSFIEIDDIMVLNNLNQAYVKINVGIVEIIQSATHVKITSQWLNNLGSASYQN